MREIKTKAQLADISARLNELLDEENFSESLDLRQKELAKIMGTTALGARKWLTGRGLPELKKLQLLVKACNCSLDWLLSGVGSMRPPTNDAAPTAPVVSKEAAKLIRHIMKIDETSGIPDETVELISFVLKQVEKSKH